jgi:hypothetical protein
MHARLLYAPFLVEQNGDLPVPLHAGYRFDDDLP